MSQVASLMRTICLIVYGMAILCDCGAILGVSEDDKALDQLVGVVVSIIRFMWVTTRGWLSLNETMLCNIHVRHCVCYR